MPRIIPVILAGGNGERLWPLSRQEHPKQFVTLPNMRHSLLQNTVLRCKDMGCSFPPIIVCHEDHRFLVARQLEEIGVSGKILVEPYAKNTAAATAFASFFHKQSDDYMKDDVMIIAPADHLINVNHKFIRMLEEASLSAHKNIVCFGVKPTHACTGYGYIKVKSVIDNNVYSVDKFIEKPDYQTASKYIREESFYWNSGIFIFSPDIFLSEIKKLRNDIYVASKESVNKLEFDIGFIRPNKICYKEIPNISIDHAVMENSNNLKMMMLQAKWSDIGSWLAIFEEGPKDENNNAGTDGHITIDTKNCLLESSGPTIATIGLDNIAIISTEDAILVSSLSKTEELKKVVNILKETKKDITKFHNQVIRPWGSYRTVSKGQRFAVKVIVVDINKQLSKQKHNHRSEHWIIVKGSAKVVCDDNTFILHENESTFIPIGSTHQLINNGKIPLELIEVQSGSYLGEDDIVRYEDSYGRADIIDSNKDTEC